MKSINHLIAAVAAIFFGCVSSANAAEVLCQSTDRNHMFVDSASVTACIDAGVGNIGQTDEGSKNDDFLKSLPVDHGFVTLGDQQWDQNGDIGTFTIKKSFWDLYDILLIGFKFGTGNTPDEWFVYELAEDVFTGAWEFVGVGETTCNKNGVCKTADPKAGGLSHVTVYGKDPIAVPEPGSLALLGAAFLGLVAVRRRRG